MGVWIAKQRPSGPVQPGHIAEARRAAASAGTALAADDERLLDALWTARALPALLDALGDARAERRLDRLVLRPEAVARARAVSPGEPLLAIALYEAGAREAEVRFVPRPADAGAPSEESPVRVRFSISERPVADGAPESVAIQRFRVGRAGPVR